MYGNQRQKRKMKVSIILFITGYKEDEFCLSFTDFLVFHVTMCKKTMILIVMIHSEIYSLYHFS